MTIHFTETSWFLAQLKPNGQHLAERNLRRQNFRTFLPLQEMTTRRNGRFISALRPLFPGYLFVAFNPARGAWRAINSTHGVTKLVSFGRFPTSLPRGLVPDLMLHCDERGVLLPQQSVNPGDTVTLTSGAFADFVATVERIEPDRRVWVLLDLMGRTTRVAVEPDSVRAV